MSIFGDNNAGSLGQIAPDTGRGDAFDNLARQRGWGQSPACGPVTPVGYLAHTHRGLGQEFTEVQLNPPLPVPLYPGQELQVQALQGMGALPQYPMRPYRARPYSPRTARVTALQGLGNVGGDTLLKGALVVGVGYCVWRWLKNR